VAKKEDPGERRKQKEAAIVDKLLKQLPHADPTLGRSTGQSRKQQTPRGQMAAAKPISRPDLHVPPPSPLKTWAWAVLSLTAAVGLTQWPYAHSCGWGLLFYMTGVSIVLVAAFWGAIVSWKSHRAVAHVISLGVVAFTGVLVAGEVLPRTGYARAEATWRCVAEPAGADQTAQPAVTDSAGLLVPPSVGDSAGTPTEQATPDSTAGD
jgi:hypothetical protein